MTELLTVEDLTKTFGALTCTGTMLEASLDGKHLLDYTLAEEDVCHAGVESRGEREFEPKIFFPCVSRIALRRQ